MAHTAEARVTDRETGRINREDALVLGGVTGGHAISHFVYQSFLVMLPTVRDALGIGPVQVGAIMTARELASGLVSIPGGVAIDRVRRHWGLVLAICLAIFGLGWLIVSIAPTFVPLVAGMVVLSMSASLWHLPAMAALSLRFSNRRGTALSIHGVGGNVGDVFGPILTGILLAYASWRGVLGVYALIPMVLALFVARTFRDLGRANDANRSGPRISAREAVGLLRNPTLLRVNVVAGLRAMCYQVYTTFLPLYLADELGFDSRAIGVYVALVFSLAIVATPAMGYLSDRIGRKAVVVPTLAGSCLLSILLALFGQSGWLAVILLLLGLFLRSDYSLISATVLDVVGQDVATTTLGVVSFTTFVLGAISPLIAGALYERWGMDVTLYYAAALFALATVIFATIRLSRDGPPEASQTA
ncbi:MAG: MFS transporter [Anaerolineae bacterium]|nr:MFS transporter [Anaerolineae bacterium]